MAMNYSAADELRLQREPIPPELFEYVDPANVSVRTLRPKWTWVARVCHEIPVGRAILLPKPEGMLMGKFLINLRCALAMAKPTVMDKFSIRRAMNGDYAVVMKSGTWAKMYRDMEEA
jgi:hypothetical protein